MSQIATDDPLIANESGSLLRTDETRESKRPAGGYSFLYAVAIAVVGAIVAFNVIRPITVLPRITPSPGYAFLDQNGRTVTSEDQRGKLTLYSFSYSGCEDPCPQSLNQIDSLHSQLEDLPADIPLSFVTISLDPELDSTERLTEVSNRLDGMTPGGAIPWSLLTGDPQRTRLVVGGGFRVFYSVPEGDQGNQISFEPRYVLVDHLGIMRAEYRTAEPDPALIRRDINLILNEANNSDGIARLGYEAAHLFLCYPR